MQALIARGVIGDFRQPDIMRFGLTPLYLRFEDVFRAAEILAEVDAGHAHVIFPTRRNLERLARFASIAEAYADAARHAVTRITPWLG